MSDEVRSHSNTAGNNAAARIIIVFISILF